MEFVFVAECCGSVGLKFVDVAAVAVYWVKESVKSTALKLKVLLSPYFPNPMFLSKRLAGYHCFGGDVCVAFKEQKLGPKMDNSSREESFLKSPALPDQVLLIHLCCKRCGIVGVSFSPDCHCTRVRKP